MHMHINTYILILHTVCYHFMNITCFRNKLFIKENSLSKNSKIFKILLIIMNFLRIAKLKKKSNSICNIFFHLNRSKKLPKIISSFNNNLLYYNQSVIAFKCFLNFHAIMYILMFFYVVVCLERHNYLSLLFCISLCLKKKNVIISKKPIRYLILHLALFFSYI